MKDTEPYCFMEVYERNVDKGDNWGAKRFAVTFLFADGIASYYQLFAEGIAKPLGFSFFRTMASAAIMLVSVTEH